VKVNFIVGFPQETSTDLWRTLVLAVRMAALGAHDCSVSIFSPYPGSELFDDLYGTDHRAIDDRFFLSLGAYTDMSKVATAWSRLNPYFVGLSRVAIFLAFYGVSFLTHPARLLRVLREIFSDRQTSRGAMALRRFVIRKRDTRSFAAPPRLHLRAGAGAPVSPLV
jgi:hypothetical protein